MADGTVTLPMLTLQVRAYKGSAPECVVMNTKNFAVSEYDNYGFNSMVRFNGANLIADQNGIYEHDSSDLDDSVYKIKSSIKSGIIDVYSDAINRLRDSYLLYRSDGDIRLVSNADKKATRQYLLPSNGNTKVVKKRRIKFERGIRNRHFDFKIENINGSQMEIDKFTVTLEPVISKRR